MAKRMTYKDALALRARPPLPPMHKLRTAKCPGDRELMAGGKVHIHGLVQK